MEGKSILQETIEQLSKHQKLHICVHDLSGIFDKIPDLAINLHYKIHSAPMCNKAKTTAAGFRRCLRCKSWAVKKAIHGAYEGYCYLGVYEIVRPVFFHNKPVCILFIGNALAGSISSFQDRIEKSCKRTGVDQALLLDALNTLQPVTDSTDAIQIADILEFIILNTLEKKAPQTVFPQNTAPIQSNTKHWAVKAVELYIKTYYDRPIKLSYLANLYFIHPDYLSRLFKKETGLTFSEYLNRVRIGQARELLADTSQSVTSICYETGFNNVCYFNKLFKRMTDMSPREYRKSL